MKKIYIDIGNSFIKVCERKEFSWHTLFHMRSQSAGTIAEELNGIDTLNEIVIASVRNDVFENLESNLSDVSISRITTDRIPSFFLDYNTPQTLGIDRFLVCLAACSISSNDVIVIDTGSACTIDLMTSDLVYHGGVIMPGVDLYRESMKVMLPELPATDKELPANWPGKSTDECIRWGVYGAFLLALRSFVEKFTKELDACDLYVTGGGAGYIMDHLGEELNLKQRPDLIFEGMQEFEKRMPEKK